MDFVLNILSILAIGIYTLAMGYIMFFCLLQFHLMWLYLKKSKKRDELSTTTVTTTHWPHITIQLPVYNEKYVVERLIRQTAKLDYPPDLLEIQILDDSNDETSSIIKTTLESLQPSNINFRHLRRSSREGYKAGALQHFLCDSKGAFIAIFDADFLPETDFLKKTIPYFQDEEIGVVQSRWDHINADYSVLTRLQAIQLNVHFTIEQSGRQNGNLYLQFNGTGGIWRKATILDAGGWSSDTLTEDLDLSYRAQLKGWKIKYLETLPSPAELPAEMHGIKSQQFRWMKGGAETARKILPAIWRSNLNFSKKIHSTFHLLSSSLFVFILLAAIFSVPVLIFSDLSTWNLNWMVVFFIGLFSIIIVYITAHWHIYSDSKKHYKNLGEFIFLFPLFLALSMGLSLHNSVAVLMGFAGKKTPFIRTPKFNLLSRNDKITDKVYRRGKLPPLTIWEGLLTLYFLSAIIYAFCWNNTSFIVYHILLATGFGAIFFYSVIHSGKK